MTSRARQRELQNARHHRLLAEGRCPQCGLELTEEEKAGGYTVCTICRAWMSDYKKELNAKLIANGQCIICRRPREPERMDRQTCAACAARQLEYHRVADAALRKKRKESGLCLSCERPLSEIDGGYKTCLECRKKQQTQVKKRYAFMVQKGICVHCQQPVEQWRIGKHLCQKCQDHEVDLQRKRRERMMMANG